MNRISTSQLYSNTLNILSRKQSNLADLQQALATGKRVTTAADDPVGTGRLLEIRALADRVAQYERNSDAAEARLVNEETVLTQAADNLNRVREIALAAINGIHDATSLGSFGLEVQARLDELVGLANTSDANGEYLFAGTASRTLPFTLSGTANYAYFGNNQQRTVNISDNQSVAMTDPGSDIFINIPEGNGRFQVSDNPANTGTAVAGDSSIVDPTAWVPDTYTVTFLDTQNYEVRDSGGGLVSSGVFNEPGTISFGGAAISLVGVPEAGDTFTVDPDQTQDVFTTLQDLSAALNGSANLSDAALNNLLNRSIQNIDQALTVNQNTRSSIGTRLQVIDSYRDLNQRDLIQARTIQSRIEDLDYAAAISEFEYESTILQAAQQTFLALKDLNLFRLL